MEGFDKDLYKPESICYFGRVSRFLPFFHCADGGVHTSAVSYYDDFDTWLEYTLWEQEDFYLSPHFQCDEIWRLYLRLVCQNPAHCQLGQPVKIGQLRRTRNEGLSAVGIIMVVAISKASFVELLLNIKYYYLKNLYILSYLRNKLNKAPIISNNL